MQPYCTGIGWVLRFDANFAAMCGHRAMWRLLVGALGVGCGKCPGKVRNEQSIAGNFWFTCPRSPSVVHWRAIFVVTSLASIWTAGTYCGPSTSCRDISLRQRTPVT